MALGASEKGVIPRQITVPAELIGVDGEVHATGADPHTFSTTIPPGANCVCVSTAYWTGSSGIVNSMTLGGRPPDQVLYGDESSRDGLSIAVWNSAPYGNGFPGVGPRDVVVDFSVTPGEGAGIGVFFGKGYFGGGPSDRITVTAGVTPTSGLLILASDSQPTVNYSSPEGGILVLYDENFGGVTPPVAQAAPWVSHSSAAQHGLGQRLSSRRYAGNLDVQCADNTSNSGLTLTVLRPGVRTQLVPVRAGGEDDTLGIMPKRILPRSMPTNVVIDKGNSIVQKGLVALYDREKEHFSNDPGTITGSVDDQKEKWGIGYNLSSINDDWNFDGNTIAKFPLGGAERTVVFCGVWEGATAFEESIINYGEDISLRRFNFRVDNSTDKIRIEHGGGNHVFSTLPTVTSLAGQLLVGAVKLEGGATIGDTRGFLNGQFENGSGASVFNTTDDTPTHSILGRDGYTQGLVNGSMFWIGLWNRALSDSDLLSLYHNPWQLFAPKPQLIPIGKKAEDDALGIVPIPVFGRKYWDFNAADDTLLATHDPSWESVGKAGASNTWEVGDLEIINKKVQIISTWPGSQGARQTRSTRREAEITLGPLAGSPTNVTPIIGFCATSTRHGYNCKIAWTADEWTAISLYTDDGIADTWRIADNTASPSMVAVPINQKNVFRIVDDNGVIRVFVNGIEYIRWTDTVNLKGGNPWFGGGTSPDFLPYSDFSDGSKEVKRTQLIPTGLGAAPEGTKFGMVPTLVERLTEAPRFNDSQKVTGGTGSGGATLSFVRSAFFAGQTSPVRGVIAHIAQLNNTIDDHVLLYGGKRLKKIRELEVDGAGNIGSVKVYFLGEDLPQGDQDLVMTCSLGDHYLLQGAIITNGNGPLDISTEVYGELAASNPTFNPKMSRQGLVFQSIYVDVGSAAPVGPSSGWTEADEGTQGGIMSGLHYSASPGGIERGPYVAGATFTGPYDFASIVSTIHEKPYTKHILTEARPVNSREGLMPRRVPAKYKSNVINPRWSEGLVLASGPDPTIDIVGGRRGALAGNAIVAPTKHGMAIINADPDLDGMEFPTEGPLKYDKGLTVLMLVKAGITTPVGGASRIAQHAGVTEYWEVVWTTAQDVQVNVYMSGLTQATLTDGLDDGTNGALATDWNVVGFTLPAYDGNARGPTIRVNKASSGPASTRTDVALTSGSENIEFMKRGNLTVYSLDGGEMPLYAIWERELSSLEWNALVDNPFDLFASTGKHIPTEVEIVDQIRGVIPRRF